MKHITLTLLLLLLLPSPALAVTPNDEAYYPAPTKTNKPIIALIHGGGWTMGDNTQTTPWAIMLNKLGYPVINVDYRLACNEADCPHAKQIVGDVYRDIREARANHTKLRTTSKKVVAVGFSAGGHLSVLAASTGVANAAIGFSPPIQLANSINTPLENYTTTLIGCTIVSCPHQYTKYSPNNYHKNRNKIYIAYGAQETMVPPALHGDYMPGAIIVRVPGNQHSSAEINSWEKPYLLKGLSIIKP
jgi:acetyl esterase/lipase